MTAEEARRELKFAVETETVEETEAVVAPMAKLPVEAKTSLMLPTLTAWRVYPAL